MVLLLMIALWTPAGSVAQDAKPGVAPEAVEAAKVGSLETRCEDGLAGGYPCSNVNLVSFLPLHEMGAAPGITLNDAWGWVDAETGQRWALVGREDGTAFVEITDPERPRYAGELPMPPTAQSNVWRDIKVDGWYAFVVADGSASRQGMHGMQVFDLRRLRDATGAPVTFQSDAHYEEFAVAHNVVINEESDRAYVVGARQDKRSCNAGLHMIDISDPLQPTFIGCFADVGTGRAGGGYTHDAQCVVYHGPDAQYQGREICVGANETAISVADVTDVDNPIALSRGAYPAASYVHQGWFTEDQRYFIQNDELDERVFDNHTHTYIWDMTDLDDPVLLKDFASDAVSTDHNLYVRGDQAYQANYSSGLRIMDVSDPSDPFVAGFFDTRPQDSAVNFNGAWTAWPFPDSDLVIISSRGEGLFVVRPAAILGARFTDVEVAASPRKIVASWSLNRDVPLARLEVVRRGTTGSPMVLAEVNGAAASSSPQTVSLDVDEDVFDLQIIGYGADGGRIEAGPFTVNTLASSHLLDPVWPNPASGSARARLAVLRGQHVRVSIHDAVGRERALLLDGVLSADRAQDIDVDVSNLPAGTYYLHVVGQHFVETRPFIVAR